MTLSKSEISLGSQFFEDASDVLSGDKTVANKQGRILFAPKSEVGPAYNTFEVSTIDRAFEIATQSRDDYALGVLQAVQLTSGSQVAIADQKEIGGFQVL